MSREAVGQSGPGRSLAGFPRSSLTTPEVLWRTHKQNRGPWWFSSRGGRFDLAEPRGTCYAARDLEAAVREAAGARLLTVGIVAQPFAAARVVSTIHVSEQAVLADVTARDAVTFGVSRELSTMTPYDVPCEWAEAFAVDHDGIEYHSRFTSGDMRCVALFGRAGAPEVARAHESMSFSEAARLVGITVATAPRVRPRPSPGT